MTLTTYSNYTKSDRTTPGWTGTRKSTRPGNIRATLFTMSSEYVIKSENTTIEIPAINLDARWDRILSFAGILSDSDELTEEWLADFRQSAWGNRLDDTDEPNNDAKNPA